MYKAGQIIFVQFNPQIGHEQAGYRPALIVSNNSFNRHTQVYWCCPITSSDRAYPLHLRLPAGLKTHGNVMGEQIKAMDLNARKCKVIEEVPAEFLKQVRQVLVAVLLPDE